MRPCKLWTGSNKNRDGRQADYGYLYVDGVHWYAHRWVFFQAYGWLPEVVRHSCDNPPCVEPTHLIAGTQKDNLRDSFDRGRARRAQGEAASKAKLTEAQVLQIRDRLQTERPAVLAREFGVEHKTIRQIRDRKTWRHI